MLKRRRYTPPWTESPPLPGTYRALLKWGDPNEFKHPNWRLYELLKQVLDMTDDDFRVRTNTGEAPVRVEQPCGLKADVLASLAAIVGRENVKTDDWSRASACYGKTWLDVARLRAGVIENPPDAVVCPRNADDVRRLVAFCNERRIPMTPFGAGSGVTRGSECVKGGVSLHMGVHMNRVLALDPINQTVTVEPGIYGPALEGALNEAPERFGAPHRYTCGHFPQSFEYSTVGGWVVTRGAGQNSTYYGKIEHLVLSQKYVTPVGEVVTVEVPAKATGPDIDQIMIGSEGAYGVLGEVTLKVYRYRPQARQRFSFVFRDWGSACEACRQVMQGEFGFPSVFRLSDTEETDVAFKLYGVDDTPLDWLLQRLGYRPMARCLLLGHTDGDGDLGKLIQRKVRRICRRYGAVYTTGYVTRRWEHGRFRDPYLRDDLGDFGVVLDTLECGVNWANLQQVWAGVREVSHARPNTICMAHASHFYPQGTNLYFIFIARMAGLEEYLDYQASILDAIRRCGATMSHHHGIGKMLAPWLEDQIGADQMAILRALKRHFDPNGIMNPGGTLGLNFSADEKRPFS
ncbi:MAG: FAD-binding oxidoreductase [Anaerolineae bacterium]|nr:MAG: FAD-binding oxidoreductase [Anaerolineae bacterium]